MFPLTATDHQRMFILGNSLSMFWYLRNVHWLCNKH